VVAAATDNPSAAADFEPEKGSPVDVPARAVRFLGLDGRKMVGLADTLTK
jgi:hypothetical protein